MVLCLKKLFLIASYLYSEPSRQFFMWLNHKECYHVSLPKKQCMNLHVWYNLWFWSAGSFAGLGFLSLYLSGKIQAFDRRGHVAKLCIIFLPLLVASLIGVSRVNDYWHHWQDVFAGGLLGMLFYDN